jgi:hypothetical protein
MPEMGHDMNMQELADLLYLVQPPYHLLRNRKWTGYRQQGSVRRADYASAELSAGASTARGTGSRDSYVEVDPAKPGYKVVVDGNLVARDFTTVFAGPRKGTLLAYSRTRCDLDWRAPAGWKNGEIPAVTLTDSGPGVAVPARIERGRLRLTLQAHQPVRIGPR